MELAVTGREAYAYTGGRPFDATLPTVVFIHGAQQDHCVWVLQSRYLAHHGRGVLAIDLPGHGRSEGPPLATIAEISDWVAALLDAARLTQASLVGHSMGALVALEGAARHPERIARIALLGAAAPMRVSPELLTATRDDEALAQAMVNIWSHSAYAHYPSNPGPGFWVMGENLRLMERQKTGVMHTDFKACNDYAGGLEAAAKVRCEALLVLGQEDVMTPIRAARGLAATLRGVKIVEIAASGHALMAEQPDAVLDALCDFLPRAP